LSISIRPNRRFPIHCSVTYNAGLFLRLPLGNLLALLILLLSSGAAYAEWVKINENDTFTVYTDPDTIRREGEFSVIAAKGTGYQLDQAPLFTLCGHLRVARNDRALLRSALIRAASPPGHTRRTNDRPHDASGRRTQYTLPCVLAVAVGDRSNVDPVLYCSRPRCLGENVSWHVLRSTRQSQYPTNRSQQRT